jgi:hypothetical protein
MLKSPLPRSLRAIAAALEGLDEQELDALIAGKGKLVFVASEQSPVKCEVPMLDSAAILERLHSCTNRDSGRAVLSEITSRDVLSSLARSQKIHVAKHDRREDIESKIIQFVIGGKLRSEAIETLNLSGSGPNNGSQGSV